MKKSLVILSLSLASIFQANAVVVHQPNQKIEQGLNTFGAGIANWEEQHLGAYTYPDAHLFHKHAIIEHGDKMPLKLTAPIELSNHHVFAGNQSMDLYAFMRDRANIHNYVVMTKDGTIIAEDYWNGTNTKTKNHLMSASKSFTSMVLAIAVEKGFISYNDKIEKWIPEFKHSPLAGQPLRNFSDMRSGIRTIDSKYDDDNGYHWSMGEWSTWDWAMPLASGYNGFDTLDGKVINKSGAHGRLDGIEEFLKILANKVKPVAPGVGYNYKCVNTEIIGLSAERAIAAATGMSFNAFMEQELWKKGGFQEPVAAFLDLNHDRMPYSGGLNMTTRDFAIAMNLIANEGKNFKGEQILPLSFIERLRNGDDAVKQAWKFTDNQEQVAGEGFYADQFRTISLNGRPISAMVGVNGQWNVIDWNTGTTVSIFSSFGKPSGPSMIATFFTAIDALFTLADQHSKK
ncbi:serine hydrolase [Shewanella sp. UCD-KL12]|uniref:serine hydrolase domain-containing protein n=1 Tax=Shewanella sp. UCD-KL12 TaxID=1917163 RepID=UPI000970AE28|nr:serine hydrolase [Shewanella sp. UCD-KL12]